MAIRQILDRYWVIEGDQLHPRWIEQAGRLDHDGYIKDILAPCLQPGQTVVDVGAHWGTHALFYRDRVGQTGRVVAYEPHPESFQCLVRNVPGILAYSVALGDRKTQESILMDPRNAGASYVGGPGPLVSLQTLDDHSKLWLEKGERIAFIKIDAEGMEPEVLNGAQATLRKHRPILYIEVNPGALRRRGHSANGLKEQLALAGYRVEFYPPGSHWDSLQSDILCFPEG